MIPTPRTDDVAGGLIDADEVVPADFARQLERENAALRAALDAQMQYQRDLRADRDRLDWQERSCAFLAVELPPEEYRRISPTRQGIDAAMREDKP